MSIPLKPMGEFFKSRRSEMGLSLKEVENSTSIRMSHIKAIEEDTIQNMIALVYARGFVKQYAHFLGIEENDIIETNLSILDGVKKSVSSRTEHFPYHIGDLEVRGNKGKNVKWLPNMMWIAVAFGMIFFAWYLARFFEVL